MSVAPALPDGAVFEVADVLGLERAARVHGQPLQPPSWWRTSARPLRSLHLVGSGASHEHQDNEDYQDDDEHPAADVDPAVADKCCD